MSTVLLPIQEERSTKIRSDIIPRIDCNTELDTGLRALDTVTGRANYLFRRLAVLLKVSRCKAIVRQLTEAVKLHYIYIGILGVVLRVCT